jgi:hypothetical protein
MLNCIINNEYYLKMVHSLLPAFLGKTHTVSTPGARLKGSSLETCVSSPTIPRSAPSTTSAVAASSSDWALATAENEEKLNSVQTGMLTKNSASGYVKMWERTIGNNQRNKIHKTIFYLPT